MRTSVNYDQVCGVWLTIYFYILCTQTQKTTQELVTSIRHLRALIVNLANYISASSAFSHKWWQQNKAWSAYFTSKVKGETRMMYLRVTYILTT